MTMLYVPIQSPSEAKNRNREMQQLCYLETMEFCNLNLESRNYRYHSLKYNLTVSTTPEEKQP